MIKDKKKQFGWDNWVKDLDMQRDKSVDYNLDIIVDQLENSNYSSLDPEIRTEIKKHEVKKNKTPEKDPEVSS